MASGERAGGSAGWLRRPVSRGWLLVAAAVGLPFLLGTLMRIGTALGYDRFADACYGAMHAYYRIPATWVGGASGARASEAITNGRMLLGALFWPLVAGGVWALVALFSPRGRNRAGETPPRRRP